MAHLRFTGVQDRPAEFLDVTSASSSLNFGVERLQFHAGIFNAELPATPILSLEVALVQWHSFQPHASGFVPLSIAEFRL